MNSSKTIKESKKVYKFNVIYELIALKHSKTTKYNPICYFWDYGGNTYNRIYRSSPSGHFKHKRPYRCIVNEENWIYSINKNRSLKTIKSKAPQLPFILRYRNTYHTPNPIKLKGLGVKKELYHKRRYRCGLKILKDNMRKSAIISYKVRN